MGIQMGKAETCPKCGSKLLYSGAPICSRCGKPLVDMTPEDLVVEQLAIADGTGVAIDRLWEEIGERNIEKIDPKELDEIVERVARKAGVERGVVDSLVGVYTE